MADISLWKKSKTLMLVRVLGISVLLLPLSSCMLNQGPPEPIYYYTLDYRLESLEAAPALPVVIRVDRFSASPPYDSQRIMYADKGLHRNAYARQQWISTPGELLAFLIARDMLDSNRFQTVLAPDSLLRPTHVVNGWIEEFLEKDDRDAWRASLCLHITLLAEENRDPAERILFQKTYRAQAAAQSKTPEALARAMSTAASEVSAALIKDTYDTLKKQTKSGTPVPE